MGTPSWPRGVRFHPSDNELLGLLWDKICGQVLGPELIGVTDVYKFEPCELPEQSRLKTRDRQWFFFSPVGKKYPKGKRSSRATKFGYWKATGKDKNISWKTREMGVRKTGVRKSLVFHEGRYPKGQVTNWVMHEYAMDKDELNRCMNTGDYLAVYKLFMKSGSGPKNGEQYWAPAEQDEEVGFLEQENSDPVSAFNCFEPTTSTAAATAITTSTTATTVLEASEICAPGPLSVDLSLECCTATSTAATAFQEVSGIFDPRPLSTDPSLNYCMQLSSNQAGVGTFGFGRDESLGIPLVQQHSATPEEHATIQQCSGVENMLSSDESPVGLENLDEILGEFFTNDEAEVNQQHCQPIANGSQAGGVELVEVPKVSDSVEDFFELDDLPSEGNFANNGTYQFTEFPDWPPYGGHSMVLEEANEGAHHGLIGNMNDCSPHSQCTYFQRSNVFSSPATTHVVMAPPASGNLYASSLMNGEITQGFLGMPESVPTNPCHVGLRELEQGIRGDVKLGCIAEWGRDCCQYSFEGCCLEEDVDEEKRS